MCGDVASSELLTEDSWLFFRLFSFIYLIFSVLSLPRTFHLNYYDFNTNFPINPFVTSSLCSLQTCHIAVFGIFSQYFNRIYLTFIIF